MLVFQEGLPRSGKSYDTVLNHIVRALKSGRKVYARLNGMENDKCRDALAKWIGKPRAYIDSHLFHVDTADVATLFRAIQDDGLKWRIDDRFRNALCVIDEIHEFFVGGTREPMLPENEQFFALHGHYGIDIVVMSQHYKRTHTAVRYRVERKNVYQKLSALGKKGEKLYQQTYYQAVAPDKYEKVGAQTHSYDEKVFDLYHGIVPAVGENGEQVSQEVYSAGRMTVWRSMALRAAIILPLGLFAVIYLLRFFTGGVQLVKTPEIAATKPMPMVQGEVIGPDSATASKGGAVVAKAPTPADIAKAEEVERLRKLAELSPEQRYVWELGDKGRVRLAAMIGEGDMARGVVEWVNSSQVIVERLTLAQLRALGIGVSVHGYGVRLVAKDQAIVVTAWPYDAPKRDVRPELYDTSGGLPNGVSVSEHPSADAASNGSSVAISYSGQLPVGAGTMGGGAP